MTMQQVIALQAFVLAAVEHAVSCSHDKPATFQKQIEAQTRMLEVFTSESENEL